MLPTAKNALAALSPQQRLVLGALFASIALASVSLADPRGLRRLQKLEVDISRQEQGNPELGEENDPLPPQVKDLSPPVNAAALERTAREQLGFVRPDDVLFKFE